MHCEFLLWQASLWAERCIEKGCRLSVQEIAPVTQRLMSYLQMKKRDNPVDELE